MILRVQVLRGCSYGKCLELVCLLMLVESEGVFPVVLGYSYEAGRSLGFCYPSGMSLPCSGLSQ
jgi:hypothetical protein